VPLLTNRVGALKARFFHFLFGPMGSYSFPAPPGYATALNSR